MSTSALSAPRRRRRSLSAYLRRTRVKELTFLTVGLATPVGLLVVNAAAFVMNHLANFQLAISVSALVSSLSLSGLAAYGVLNQFARFFPSAYRRFRRWFIAAAAVAVIAWSVLGAWGCYWSLSSKARLPSLPAVIVAIWLLALPFAGTFVLRWLRRPARVPSHGPAAAGP
jgi:hypothetical protein